MKSDFTHLLFIDSDIEFQPEAVLELLKSKKDVACCAYPRKSYNFKRLNKLSRTYSNSMYRYYYGEFNTYSQAKSYLSFVKKKGYKGAYIKGFRNGIEININSKMKKD